MASENVCSLRWKLYKDLRSRDGVFRPVFKVNTWRETLSNNNYDFIVHLGNAPVVLNGFEKLTDIFMARRNSDNLVTLLAVDNNTIAEVWTIEV